MAGGRAGERSAEHRTGAGNGHTSNRRTQLRRRLFRDTLQLISELISLLLQQK
jgi:hypothetical protein